MNTLVDIISGMEVKEDDDNFMNAVDYMFAGLEKRKPDCFAVKQYKKYNLGDRRTAAFFIINDTDTTYNFIVALAFSQMFNLLCERADNVHRGRLPHHMRVLWDAAANTGQVPNLEKLVSAIRSRKVSLTLFY